jgi:O-antigen/teichoic acid export membrane protein
LINKLKALIQHQGFIKYFKNTSWLMGERILRMGVGLFVGVWVARYLGPEQFGLLSYAQSLVFLFTAIATLGLDGIVVRELVKYPEKRSILLGTAFGLKLSGAILILPILAVAVQLTSNDNYTNLLVFIIASATIFQSFNVIDFYCQATVQSKYVALANAATLAISSVIKVALLLNESPLIAFAAMIVFDSVVLSSGLIFFYFKQLKFKLIDLKYSRTIAVELLRDSWPLILSGLVISVYMKIDQIMIKEILGNEAVGQYAAAVKISEVWYFIPVVIASSLFPAIINSKKKNEHSYHARLQNLYDLMVMLSLTIAIPMTFIGSWLVKSLFGMEYSEAASVLLIHIWASIFVFLGVPTSKWFVLEGMQKYSFYRAIFAVAVNVLLNAILIPYNGVIGAAIATLASTVLASYIFNGVFQELRQNFIMQTKAIFFLYYYIRRLF